ncbi:MAG: Ldh family oxidoreductase [Bacteroidetes bacterium]|nr:Ldh family oxidoreductase [Bacteroidota bacterium]
MVKDESMRISYEELWSYCYKILVSAGTSDSEAHIVSDVLLWTEFIERGTNGLSSRLPLLAERVNNKLIKSPSEPVFEIKTETISILNGDNGFGQVNGTIAMKKAIQVAKDHGVGLVFVNHSNHYGAGAYYCKLAIEENLIGFTTSNAYPKVAPFGGSKPVLGTNPLSLGCPTGKEYPLLIDMATSAFAQSTVREFQKANKLLPDDVALDVNGRPTNNPLDVNEGCLLPSGGAKGFSLGIMVELFSGILSGAGFSFGVGSIWKDQTRGSNTGHFFLALNPASIMSFNLYLQRMQSLIEKIEGVPTYSKTSSVRIPGKIRYDKLKENMENGICINSSAKSKLNSISIKFRVKPPWQL